MSHDSLFNETDPLTQLQTESTEVKTESTEVKTESTEVKTENPQPISIDDSSESSDVNKIKKQVKEVIVEKKVVGSQEFIKDLESPASENLDLLDVDTPIRGQKFCCLSFAEPKLNPVMKLENYVMNEFMKEFLSNYTRKVVEQVANDYELDVESVKERYALGRRIEDKPENFTDEEWKNTKDVHMREISNHFFKADIYDMLVKYMKFKEVNLADLRRKLSSLFPEEGFRSAVKFRGAFPTYNKAKKYAEKLFKKDKVVNIFALESGKWVPFNPGEEEIKNQKTTHKKLNNLMWQYRKNQVYAEHFFNERKEEMLKERASTKLNKLRARGKTPHTEAPPKLAKPSPTDNIDQTEVDDIIANLKKR